MANVTQAQWAAALLKRLGIPQSHGALRAVVGWENAEGGHFHNSARFNPLNTTQPMPGAGNTGTQGNIKVYKSWQQGLDATVKTLRNGLYGGILHALKAGNPNAVGQAIERSPWGTGGLAAKVIGQTHVGGSVQPSSALLRASGGGGGGSAPIETSRSGEIGQGADILSLLQSLGTKQPRASAGVPAPAFSAHPALPTGAQIPQGGGGGGMSQGPDITQLLASIATPAGGIQHTTVTGGGATGGGGASGGGGGSPGHLPKGVSSFEGTPVAAWIKPYLVKARQMGWKGQLTSGYRSYAKQKQIYDSGVRPAAKPGTSNHEGDVFPRGAVDVDRQSAAQLAQILRRLRAPLVWAGAKDPVHFSHPHNGGY